MTTDKWTAVDAYINERLDLTDETMTAVLAANAAAELPAIDVSPALGKFLQLLVRITGARRVLEIGTLGGYSTLWMARRLPADGVVVTLESDPHHSEVARRNFFDATDVASTIEMRGGPALEALAQMETDNTAPFDLIFIDADKENNPHYLDWAVKLARPGTVIIVDNVVRDGSVLDEASTDPKVMGTRALFDALKGHPRLRTTALQTVGQKGWDGFVMAVVD
jgi:predicted O-methyltransferase YrrM